METYYINGTFTVIFYIVIFCVVVLSGVFRNVLYYNSTKFTKTITIRKNYMRNRSSSKGDEYFVTDTNNVIYQVDNLWFAFDYNRADDWTNLMVGHTFKVTGYGVRVGYLDMYPIINSIKKIN